MEDSPYTVPLLHFNVTNENKYMKDSAKSGERDHNTSSSGSSSLIGSGGVSGRGSRGHSEDKGEHRSAVTAAVTVTVTPTVSGTPAPATPTAAPATPTASARASASASGCEKTLKGSTDTCNNTNTNNNNNKNNHNNISSFSSPNTSANSSAYHTGTTSPAYPFLTPSHTPNRPTPHEAPTDKIALHGTHVSHYTPPHTSHHTTHTPNRKMNGDTNGWTEGQGSTWRNKESTKRHHAGHVDLAHLDEIGFEEEGDEDDDEVEEDEEEEDEEDEEVVTQMKKEKEIVMKEEARRAQEGLRMEGTDTHTEWGDIQGANGTIKDPRRVDSERGTFFGNKVECSTCTVRRS
jgi:hypothetical protein